MPTPTHIAEAALYVDDLERAVAFYTGLFERPALRPDPRFCAIRITEEQVLLLFRRGASTEASTMESGALIPAHDGSGPLHICFGIQPHELDAWTQKLTRMSIAVESRVRWPGGATSLYFRDPDNHAVELATPGLWA
jgi:catechol 2,3-dioxygenase-like lactoylglutathione lyase family enzyme